MAEVPLTMEAQVAQLLGQVQAWQHDQNAAIGALHTELQNTQQQMQALRPSDTAAIRIPKPPVFSGVRDPSALNWTYQMETYMQAHRINLETPLAVTTAAGFLSGGALTWYRLRQQVDVARGIAQPFADWAAFREALITRFTPMSPEDTARQRLAQLRQRTSVRQYAQDFNMCMLELPGMEEKDRIFHFLSGLKTNIRLHVQPHRPSTLHDAIELAIQMDTLMWQLKKGSPLFQTGTTGMRGSTFDGPTPMDLGVMQPRNAPSQKTMVCFYCKKPGHVKRDCRLRKKHMAATPRQSGN
jgi:hypothetical protein